MSAAVEVRDLRRAYGSVRAVDGLSFTAPTGAVTAVLGRNGAGKTTTVEICAGLRPRDGGSVAVLGQEPWRNPVLRPRVGVMPQAAGSGAAGVYPAARVGEVLTLFASFAAHPLDTDALLDRLDLTRLARTPWRRLSGGEQQRLSLALAVVGRPELVFLDEPTAGLDVAARHATWSLIEDLRAAGVSVLLTTHAMDEAERLADHVVVVAAGRAVAAGSPAELTRHDAGTVRFSAVPSLAVDDLAARVGGRVRESSPGEYVVEGAPDAHQALAAITAWCAERGVLPDQLSTGRRTLEDVFLGLTGESGT
ncbi:MAG: type transport system ATP-binding protein [Frankiaceae bacterium]|nr:type transport system ATP-binding protein [Frankiaceae bacterium]